MTAPPDTKLCALPGCGKTFPILENAPHKRFCSGKCKNKFHGAELKQLRAEVARRKQESREKEK